MIEYMQQLFNRFGQSLQSVLPLSPFTEFIAAMDTADWAVGLRWLNWFLPVGRILGLLLLWLTAYGAYLLYRIILRWIKAVS